MEAAHIEVAVWVLASNSRDLDVKAFRSAKDGEEEGKGWFPVVSMQRTDSGMFLARLHNYRGATRQIDFIIKWPADAFLLVARHHAGEVTDKWSILQGRKLRAGYNFDGFELDTNKEGGLKDESCEGAVMNTFVRRHSLELDLVDANAVWGTYNETSGTWNGVIGMVGSKNYILCDLVNNFFLLSITLSFNLRKECEGYNSFSTHLSLHMYNTFQVQISIRR